jgi:superoxide dismutase, Cu-Zn family
MKRLIMIFVLLMVSSAFAWADEVTVKMFSTAKTGQGKELGTILMKDTQYGALFTPQLKGLKSGLHGFHVHEKGECGPGSKDGKMEPGLAAGGHYDPSGSGRHEGPYGNGHLGDLPPLYVGTNGEAHLPVLAPRLKIAEIRNMSLMIHEGGDNYSDQPEKFGGGGARIACGVIP